MYGSWYEHYLCGCEGVAVIRQREEAIDELRLLPISVRHLGHNWPSQRAVRAGQIQVHVYLRHLLIVRRAWHCSISQEVL